MLECEEFRPTRSWKDVIWLGPEREGPTEVSLHLDIHGANLSEPVILDLPLHFAEHAASWDDDALASFLDLWLADVLAETARR